MYEFYYFENTTDIFERYIIHKASFSHLPDMNNRTLLSYDNSSSDALAQAQMEYLTKKFLLCPVCSHLRPPINLYCYMVNI